MLTGLLEKVSGSRDERLTAGTKHRLMGLVVDIQEVMETLQKKVLPRVSQEVTLDVDVDVNYAELAEQVMAMELEQRSDASEAVVEQTRLVNESLEQLSGLLGEIATQLDRSHKDEEFVRLYEQEKRRYMNSGTSKRARQTFNEWRDYTCYGRPLQENIEDYREEKLVHMFEQGVFDEKVRHMQRAHRYVGEVDFDQLDDDHRLKKVIHKYYHELRRMVEFAGGKLVVNPMRVGRYFYASRHEENARQHRNAFLKYMHKIDMAQSLLEKMQESEAEAGPLLPDVLATELAMKYWKRLQEAGFVDNRYQLTPDTTRMQSMYIADVFSDKLQLRSRWKPFQDLWHINNLAQWKWEMQETGKTPARASEIEAIFED